MTGVKTCALPISRASARGAGRAMVEDDGAEGTLSFGPEDRSGDGVAAICRRDAHIFLHQSRPEDAVLGDGSSTDAEPEAQAQTQPENHLPPCHCRALRTG